ncbi:sugar phosphate isomerase/epimerase [Paenibacillus polysaccharolyticus]|uniref:sugar phosphate isomerase/epimerase family protein n=1 Tax=Paenibacillus polysaccharolyticus TaxID=582692 RepID=UPI00209DB303|nr:sugar phosphate isomerase/epimerase [Paenibacillus polysaccharolyticus]MCP1133655.1 sugar phosphate isomerase/epimerase [Paenibacillus polysaccharolyticus]
MSIQIGLQMFSVRNKFNEDRVKTLQDLSTIGYKHIEIPVDFQSDSAFNINSLSASDLKRMTETAGIQVLGTHIPAELNEQELKEIIAYHKELGCNRAIIPMRFFQGANDAIDFSKRLNAYGKSLRTHGIQLYYHNHFQEFQKFDGKTLFEILLENTNPDYLKFELDIYWAIRGGANVEQLLKQLGTRCELIHIKDLPHPVSTINILDTLDKEKEITIHDFIPLFNYDNFVEIGQGKLDIKEIIKFVKEHTATKYIIVEQDVISIDEIKSVEISFSALSDLLGVEYE